MICRKKGTDLFILNIFEFVNLDKEYKSSKMFLYNDNFYYNGIYKTASKFQTISIPVAFMSIELYTLRNYDQMCENKTKKTGLQFPGHNCFGISAHNYLYSLYV